MSKNIYAEYAIGGLNNRNKIYKISDFKLNGESRDCFRSIFLFDENLKYFVDKTSSVSGYLGKHIADAFCFDFDSENSIAVKNEVIKFCLYLESQFELPMDNIHISFSGNKGYHVTIPIEAFTDKPEPKEHFYKIYKSIAIELTEGFQFVDTKIYEMRRIFRLINTINSKSGLYKIPLSFDELDNCSIQEIRDLAKKPRKIDSLPISEIGVNKYLNELFEKWNNHYFIAPPKIEENNKNLFLDILKGVGEGDRNDSAIKLSGMLIKNGIDREFITGILSAWNKLNKPPLDEKELEYLIRSAFNRYTDKQTYKIEIYNFQQAADKYREFIIKQSGKKINTGHSAIDNKIRGIMPGETMCILGKTSVGKSAFLQNIGLNYAKESGEPVLFFSMEMPLTSVFERSLQIETGLTGYEVENSFRKSENDINEKAKLLFGKIPNFYTIEKAGLTLEQIKNLILFAEQNVYRKKTGLVLIDYLGLVKGNRNDDIYQLVSKVARGMKDISKETNSPIIFLSQVTKKYSEYDELELGAARDSGSIDEASDFVLALWKEKDSRPTSQQTDIPLKLGILKNRKGGLGKVSITMDKKSLKIV